MNNTFIKIRIINFNRNVGSREVKILKNRITVVSYILYIYMYYKIIVYYIIFIYKYFLTTY